MSITLINALALAAFLLLAFRAGRDRALRICGGETARLHSLPNYYGYYLVWLVGLPVFLIFIGWLIAEPRVLYALVMSGLPENLASLPPERLAVAWRDIQAIAAGGAASSDYEGLKALAQDYARLERLSEAGLFAVTGMLALLLFGIGRGRIGKSFRARNRVEGAIRGVMIFASVVAILTTLGILFSVLFESIRFFNLVSIEEFLFGTQWSPQTPLREEQVGQSGIFGALPVFAGTLLIAAVAMLVAGPVGLLIAVFLSEYAGPHTRSWVKPVIEVLAGIPTVVYGFFAFLTVGPALREGFQQLGMWVTGASSATGLIGTMWDVPTQMALVAGSVMGIMIIPFVSSLSDDVINAVPQSLRDGSLALGATHSETMTRVVFPAALPGIVGAFLLAISRAIGETMIVVMAAGLAANLTVNPIEPVTTVTVQIVYLLTGDFEFGGPKTLSAFALGLVLFVVTLCLNMLALRVVQKYREKYD
ncbi:MAG: phosphate ABC transporter permease subunit PstC [Alphaproteobacteria bacterium]